jgi:hypothetical protein
MFCPNCGTQNDTPHLYCRTCGLKLDAIVAALAVQNPSEELAALLKKKRRTELLGKSALSIAGIIGLCLLLALAFFYKLELFGPQVLFGSAIGALIVFLLASTFFFSYSKFFLKIDRMLPHIEEPSELSTSTSKLLNESTIEPASVTEHSTELLHRK